MKNKKSKSSRRVMYLRDERYMPVGCIAISLNKDRSAVKYQVSVVNPVDKFERSLARHIALGRLVEKPIRIAGFDGNQDKYEINCAIMENITSSKELPSRARKAAKNWLKFNVMPSLTDVDDPEEDIQ